MKHNITVAAMLVICVFLTFSACSADAAELFEYSGTAFSAAVTGEVDGVGFSAQIEVGAPTADGIERDASISFTLPQTMSGISMTRKNGSVTVRCGELELNADAAAGWLDIAGLLLPSGNVVSVDRSSERSSRQSGEAGSPAVIRVVLSDGEDSKTIYLDSATGLPVRALLSGSRSVEVRVLSVGEGD